MSKPNEVLDYLELAISNSSALLTENIGQWWGGFAEISQNEFPYCDNLPACHINLREALDDFKGSGFPYVDRTLRIGIYATFKVEDLGLVDYRLWTVLEAMRATLEKDRTLGGLLKLPILRFDIREVPSPVGTVFVGCRRLEFEAVITEQITGV